MGSFRESFPSFEKFFAEHEGSIMCGCDHGCNQWIKKQEGRLALAVRMIKRGSPNLDKMVSLPLDRVNKIWYWLRSQDSRRFNAKLYAKERASFRTTCLEIGIDKIQAALDSNNGDTELAAEVLGTKPYVIRIGYLNYKE